jgi:pantoate--beta-alanine ligase
MSLVRTAKARGGRCVASIFVNPRQFAAHEDLDSYPRDLAGDSAKLEAAGCDLLYLPTRDIMYPAGFATNIKVDGVSARLEGEKRPHFFEGVATVVTKLFNQVQPDFAVFGEKDYQQVLVVRRLACDLDMPLEVIAAPTIREPDGLAMSSRNLYLNADERIIAGRLNVIMRDTIGAMKRGILISEALRAGRAALLEAGFAQVDYLSLHDAATMAPIESKKLKNPARLLAAVIIGRTRLIDNMAA